MLCLVRQGRHKFMWNILGNQTIIDRDATQYENNVWFFWLLLNRNCYLILYWVSKHIRFCRPFLCVSYNWMWEGVFFVSTIYNIIFYIPWERKKDILNYPSCSCWYCKIESELAATTILFDICYSLEYINIWEFLI